MMGARRQNPPSLSATIGMLAWCLSDCTAEEQASLAGVIDSSAGMAVLALFEFVIGFGRQALASFLF